LSIRAAAKEGRYHAYLLGQGHGVGQRSDSIHVKVAAPRDVDLHAWLHVRATNEPKESDSPIRAGVRSYECGVGDVLHSVHQHKGVRVAPYQRAELHAGDVECEVVDLWRAGGGAEPRAGRGQRACADPSHSARTHLHLRVSPVNEAGQVEQLGALVDLLPEALFHLLQ
jgi:hypothetical protein